MPNEMLIVHRHVVWEQVYSCEYLPWVEQYTSVRPFRNVRSWKRVSKDALMELSRQEYGVDVLGKPKHMLKMSSRANHSNFPECKICATGREAEMNAIRTKAPREVREAARAQRMLHRNDWRSERSLIGLMQKTVSESNRACWILDDKLGGQWIYHPIPKGNREEKGTASNWKYRCTLQGVTLVGKRHLFSILPPNLKVGNNFGITAFVAGMQSTHNKFLRMMTHPCVGNDDLILVCTQCRQSTHNTLTPRVLCVCLCHRPVPIR